MRGCEGSSLLLTLDKQLLLHLGTEGFAVILKGNTPIDQGGCGPPRNRATLVPVYPNSLTDSVVRHKFIVILEHALSPGLNH